MRLTASGMRFGKLIAVYRNNRAYSAGTAGLFNKAQLQNPSDWVTYAQDAIRRCQPIVEQAVTAPASANTIQLMDDISDHLCQVYDSAEFCRNVHANPEWQQQAVEAIMLTAKYIQELNMHQGLYSAVVRSLQHYDRLQSHAGATASTATSANSTDSKGSSAEVEGYTAETIVVGRALQKDFEQRGVHLDAHGQSKALQISQQIAVMGMQIAASTTDASQLGTIQVPDGPWVDELPTAWRSHMNAQLSALGCNDSFRMRGGGKAGLWAASTASKTVPLDQGSMSGIMQHVSDESVRRQVWLAARDTPEANKQAMVDFCLLRRDFAQLLGFQSHSHLQAGLASLAGTPDAVTSFLKEAHAASRHQAAEEYQALQNVCRDKSTPGGVISPKPWDKAFLTKLLKAERASTSKVQQVPRVSAWLSLPDCLHGLRSVLRQLTGVTLQELPMLPGESWAAEVRKMVAVHDSDGELGTIYLDLLPRQGKFSGAAHFTLRCGRQLAKGQYQTPVIALALSFDQPDGMLHHSSAATLVHEFGHALHSLLSRTHYQHLSGTRGAMDTVEIPSHFMENFVYDARTLQLFMKGQKDVNRAGKHAEALAQQVKEDRHLLGALDLELQVCHSMMDQMFHGPEPPQSQEAAHHALCDIWAKYSSFPQNGINPHLRFAHLVNYGGSYYSYAYAMCLASSVWEKLFQAGPLNRQAGNAFRHDFLRYGGAKDSKDLVEGVLGQNALQHAGGGFMPHVEGLLHHYGVMEMSQ